MEDSQVVVLILVDFSNAVNIVSHDILLANLFHLMISPTALNWFSSYLQGRQQLVRLDDSSSSWRDIDRGVPQGGILSPLLFTIFINLLTQNLQCAYHLYADDLQIYSQEQVDCVSAAVDRINKENFGLSVNLAELP
ncbi:hypothetical protein O3G_MSEX010168 [Manduca sexta]|uniref:Reverse transcriptase domain-containing protein n=1 Tax=Manduca sexta TaxID=7130 RepID=A0A922CTE2_MANSE|nr:hypothetical protein O3G_MSEX010168 [Manduca sexta]